MFPMIVIELRVPEEGIVLLVVHEQVPEGIVTVLPEPALADVMAAMTSEELQVAAG